MKYAIKKSGDLVHISEVERGLACECVCSSCGDVLVARKGDIKDHYFAHHKNLNCTKAFETVLHLLAKEIILNSREILLPPIIILNKYTYSKNEVKGPYRLKYTKVEAEKYINGIKPDLLITTGSTKQEKQCAIEILVTHKVEDKKCSHFENINLPAIEIDLSNVDRMIEKYELEQLIINNTDNKHWIYNPIAAKELEKIEVSISSVGLGRKCPFNSIRLKEKKLISKFSCFSCIYSVEDDYGEKVCSGYYAVHTFELDIRQADKQPNYEQYVEILLENKICPNCGETIVLKDSNRGLFWGCSNYRKCRCELYAEWETCPNCYSVLKVRESTFGKFIGCSNFPSCKYKRAYK